LQLLRIWKVTELSCGNLSLNCGFKPNLSSNEI
jgi:predicted small metal-binding protein